jgi:RNA-directed DNA polymerase
MQETKQMTAVGTPAGAVSHKEVDGHAIHWQKAHTIVRRLQARIVKATQASRWGQVKALQRLLTHAFSAQVVAVKRVTEHQGKWPPGVDGVLWETPEPKAQAVSALRQPGYRTRPLRRVDIPKSSGTGTRPLSMPCMKDRAMQALYLLALDPIAETLAAPNSYGFRLERSTADAIDQWHRVLSLRWSAQWSLEGAIRSCFDSLSHDWLVTHIPMDKVILPKWLQAGFRDKHLLSPTAAGVPQGGVISPVLMNLALTGLERHVKGACPAYQGTHRTKVHVIRLADDVRHITRRQIPFTERRGSEDTTPGSTTHLEAKAKGDKSMSLKRRRPEGVYGLAPQDPRDTVRALLPKPQFPAMEAYIPCPQRLLAGSP